MLYAGGYAHKTRKRTKSSGIAQLSGKLLCPLAVVLVLRVRRVFWILLGLVDLVVEGLVLGGRVVRVDVGRGLAGGLLGKGQFMILSFVRCVGFWGFSGNDGSVELMASKLERRGNTYGQLGHDGGVLRGVEDAGL